MGIVRVGNMYINFRMCFTFYSPKKTFFIILITHVNDILAISCVSCKPLYIDLIVDIVAREMFRVNYEISHLALQLYIKFVPSR